METSTVAATGAVHAYQIDRTGAAPPCVLSPGSLPAPSSVALRSTVSSGPSSSVVARSKSSLAGPSTWICTGASLPCTWNR